MINKSNKPSGARNIRTVIAVGVFCALAYICTVVFHFRASFLTFDLKDAVMTVGAMVFGPAYGAAMAFIVSLVEMLTISSTGIYGFIMNVIASLAFVCIGSAIYRGRRTLAGGILGMTASSVAMTAVMLAANLVITPFYMHVTVSEVAVLIPTLLLPFNLVKAIFNSALVFILYKPLSTALRAAKFFDEASHSEHLRDKRTSLAVTVVALLIAAAALAVFFIFLNGSFTVK